MTYQLFYLRSWNEPSKFLIASLRTTHTKSALSMLDLGSTKARPPSCTMFTARRVMSSSYRDWVNLFGFEIVPRLRFTPGAWIGMELMESLLTAGRMTYLKVEHVFYRINRFFACSLDETHHVVQRNKIGLRSHFIFRAKQFQELKT